MFDEMILSILLYFEYLLNHIAVDHDIEIPEESVCECENRILFGLECIKKQIGKIKEKIKYTRFCYLRYYNTVNI